MKRVISLEEIKLSYPTIYELFFQRVTIPIFNATKTKRRKDEDFHSFLTRIKAKCWCAKCKNVTLL